MGCYGRPCSRNRRWRKWECNDTEDLEATRRRGARAQALLLGALASCWRSPRCRGRVRQGGRRCVKPGTMGPGPVNACFWGVPSSNVGPINEINYPVAGQNVLAVDTDVVYYYTRLQLPAGATVTLHGQFPHSRFFSLTTYVTKGTESGLPATSIYDSQINPDPGSVNPYRPGEDRRAKNRSYTITDQRADAAGGTCAEHAVRRTGRQNRRNTAGRDDHADIPPRQEPRSQRRRAAAVTDSEPRRRPSRSPKKQLPAPRSLI